MAGERASRSAWTEPTLGWQRLVLGAVGATLFIAVYMLLNRWNVSRFEAHVDPLSLRTPLDRPVPFEPWAIWPYLLYYPLALAPLLVVRTRRELMRGVVAYAIVTVIAWVSWTAIPVRMMYPQLDCSGLSCRLVHRLQHLDGGVNIFPSLHAAHSALVIAIFLTYRHRLWPVAATAGSLVVIAAVLVGQHYVIDVLVGIPVGLWAWAVAGWVERRLFGAPVWRSDPGFAAPRGP